MSVKVIIENFHNRSHGLTYQPPMNQDMSCRGLSIVDEDKGLYFESNAVTKIHKWRTLSEDTNTAFLEAVDALNVLLEHSDHIANTKTQCQFLVSEIAKVRDAEALKKSLKRKLAFMKNKTAAKSAIKKQLRTPLQNMVNPAKPKIANPGVVASTMKTSQPSVPSNINSKREALIEECYQALIDEATRNHECDRIKENYEMVSKRFKIDSIFNEHLLGKRSIYDAVYSVTSCVSSFNAPFKNVYNTALETCWYTMTKKHIHFDPSVIVEAVTDFFIFNGGLNESEMKDALDVIDYSPIFEADHHIPVRNIAHTRNIKRATRSNHPEDVRSPSRFRKVPKTFSESDLASYLVEGITDIPSSQSKIDKIVGIPEFEEDMDINDLITNFKAQCSKNDSPTSNLIILQSLVNQIVANYPSQIPVVYKKLLDMCRMSFVIYSQSSSVEDITKINDKLIKAMRDLPMNVAQTDKIIDILESEVKYIQSRIDRLNGMDASQQTKLYQYIKNLRTNLDQLKEYKEIVKQVASQKDLPSPEEIKIKDLKEAGKVLIVCELIHNILESSEQKDPTAIIIGNVSKIPIDAVDSIIDYTNTSPSVLNKQKLREELINHRNALRSGIISADSKAAKNNIPRTSNIVDYIKIDRLNECIDSLKSPEVYNGKTTLENTIITLMCLDELLHMATESNGELFNEQYLFIDTMKALTDDIKNKNLAFTIDEQLYAALLDHQINHILQVQENDHVRMESILLSALSKSVSYAIKVIEQTWVRNALLCIIKAVEEFFCCAHREPSSYQDALMTLEDCISEVNTYYDRLLMPTNPIIQPELIRRSLCSVLESLNGAYDRINFKMHYDIAATQRR